MVRIDVDAGAYLFHRHSRHARKDVGKHARMRRIQVLDQHECHARVHGHGLQELRERLNAACRGADAYHGKRRGVLAYGSAIRSSGLLPLAVLLGFPGEGWLASFRSCHGATLSPTRCLKAKHCAEREAKSIPPGPSTPARVVWV